MTRVRVLLLSRASHNPFACRHPRLLLGNLRPYLHQPRHSISTMDSSSKMLRSNKLKQIFSEGQRPAMGFWQMLPGANVSRILARSGADWVMVDCEHGNIDGTRRLVTKYL